MRLFTTPQTCALLFLCCFGALDAQIKVQYPATTKEPVSDDYFGTKITDDYRWLEDDRSDQTAAWVKEQNTATQNYFKEVGRTDKLRQRLTELWNFNKQSVPFKKGSNYFCYKNTGLQNQSILYMAKKHDAKPEEWQVVLDPNQLSKDGTVSLNGMAISKDCKTLAYAVSSAGSDWQEIHFRDLTTQKDLPDVIKWVKFSGIAWRGNGIYYSRYDEPSGSALSQANTGHKVYYHQMGTSQGNDKLVHKDDANPDYNFSAQVTEDERYLIIYASKSTSGERPMIKDLKDPNSAFEYLCSNFDHDHSLIDNTNDTFYVHTNENASNYKLETFVFRNGKIQQKKTVIAETKDLLEGVRLGDRKLFANYLQDASSRLKAFDLSGKQIKEIKLPGICKLSGFSADKNETYAAYSISQYIAPEQVYVLNTKTFESKLLFKPNLSFRSEEYVTDQVFFTSKDGTKVPMFITRKKDLIPSPSTPCFVYGYGGFNISLGPEFRIDRALFLEAGGIYCVPNLRGGGEYGEKWHMAGTKCSKQNVFDDFIAACEYLVAKKMTSYEKIAIHGRSNGGLLIGAVMTQRPDICKVAIPTVGVLDMLRFHLFTIGRAWTVDYGCSEDQVEFNCLLKYSPYHNIQEQSYPATLVLTGDHDDRVVPAHSFKFAARLQELKKGDNPALIRIDVNAGHGAGKPTTKQIDEFADMWAFVFYNLGMSE